jgi:protein arginine kinase activator
MLCDDCKERPASVHITKINNNVKTEKHLCEQCAQKAGEMTFFTENQFSVQDFLKGMFNFTNLPHSGQSVPCPNCGMTFEDFSRGGKIGCSDCYTTFGRRFEPLLRRIHGTSRHTGKIPKRAGGDLALKQKLAKMREELEQHVRREEYEAAAKVRDAIKALEKEINKKEGL